MRAKRLTKQEREVEQKATLRRRIADAATGAAGFQIDCDDEFITLPVAGRLIPALEILFGNEQNKFLFNAHHLEDYETIEQITEMFWRACVRA
jgi:hypothetical protein